MIRRFTMLLALLLALSTFGAACAEGLGDLSDLEGFFIITSDDEPASTTDVAGDGVVLEVKSCAIRPVDELYADMVYNVSLMNWDLNSYALQDIVDPRLTFADEYVFTGVLDFAGIDTIDMLVYLEGTITFTVPYIVARAQTGELQLEIGVQAEVYDIELATLSTTSELTEAQQPFTAADREGDGLQLLMERKHIIEKLRGETDSRYKWIIQHFYLINWAQESQPLEDALSVLMAYQGKYGFEATIELPQENIERLETVHGLLVFHVPNIVTNATAEQLELNITLAGEKWDESVELSSATPASYWNDLLPFDNEAQAEIAASAIYGLDDIFEWGGHHYACFDCAGRGATFEEAVAYCERLGGYLATVSTEEENNALYSYTKHCDRNIVYIGLWCPNGDNVTWQWVNGEDAPVLWHSGEPNGRDHNFTCYWRNFSDGRWADENWIGDRSFVCEWD